jgi:hypothetical protein
MPKAPLALLAAFAVAGLAGCGDPAPAAPARPAAASHDLVDAAPLAWRDPATPGTMRDAVLAWNDVIAAFFHPPVFVPGQPPPVDARGYAMASVAIHDALNAIDRRYAPWAYEGVVTEPVSGDAAVAAAVHGVLLSLAAGFPTTGPRDYAETQYAAFMLGIPDGPQKAAGIALGQAVAAAIIARRANDGSAGPVGAPFSSPGTPGAFRPLLPNPSAIALDGVAALQRWGRQRPFAIASVSPFRAAAPYGAATLAEAVGTPAYLADYDETRRLGGIVSERTAEESEIGLFWIESSALGWNRVARSILARRQQTAWRTARLLAQMHLAIADAYIANFDSKYFWTFWRPVTAIRLGNMDPATPGDATWQVATVAAGLGATPFVPEWPSAHAMSGAAAAEVIKANVPGTTAFTMEATTLPGKPRSYRSVDEAVRDNALSRIYVGFHWRAATVEGNRLGALVGRYVAANALAPIAGE